jgi:hypothetical protein
MICESSAESAAFWSRCDRLGGVRSEGYGDIGQLAGHSHKWDFEMSKKGSSDTKEGVTGLILLAMIGLIAFGIFRSRNDPAETPTNTDPSTQATVTPSPSPPQPTPEEMAAKEKELLYGQNCLSRWDGSHEAFVAKVKARLNDPDSFDHVETITWPRRDDGRNSIMMTFSARNGFGGVITSKAMGSINGADCSDALFVEFLD